MALMLDSQAPQIIAKPRQIGQSLEFQVKENGSGIDFTKSAFIFRGKRNQLKTQAKGYLSVRVNEVGHEFGEADAQGTINLLDPTAYMDIAVKFSNVEMRNLTPYSGTFANRKIESGKLSLNLGYNIENQQLNSSNQVIVDKLKLGERVQSPQGRDLPLELAIAILEDSNGRIDLGLPITGDLNDPQFSYGAIVWKAIGNVLTKIVTALCFGHFGQFTQAP